MTDARRHDQAGRLQHVIARGVAGDRLVPDAGWATELYNAIAREARERCWQVWSFVIMGTHYHLLVATPDGSLSAGLQRAHSVHAIRRNSHDEARKGAVFGRRYDSFAIRDRQHLRNALRYIPRNPVTAGICDDAADWPFGTYRALAGLEPCPSWIPKARVFRMLEGDFADPTKPWFGERHYARMCASTLSTVEPPLRRDDWTRYDAQCLASEGMSTRQIADRLGISIRHVRRLIACRPDTTTPHL